MDLTRYRNLLVYGGSFDPPHRGHVELPDLIARRIGADGIAYIPAGVSPFKVGMKHTPAHHRVVMLRLATAVVPRAFVLTDELDRHPSYTVDTLENLRRRLHRDATMRLLIGADQLRSFDRWRNWQRIVELAEPVVMVRPPDTQASLLAALPAGFKKAEWRSRLVHTRLINVSSTAIRNRLLAGRSIEGMTPLPVVNYIRQHRLYVE